ncbi:helix-turn-helix domain-containing protein [Kribbella sp. VKM Ac-2568]|uniref:helix-turn-helix domain-containing protein n=1 Tax=Kribbella sp. VKM Ac-2568 TaxID=2512219 RepID=UPI001044FA6B|nr:helix-turn-helix domain-containing protein [Kribbella sp. VKM Ac-2568]TCM36002.1 helix-turn-helix protein [Kribbella sp. VKM Ac-2568]
MAGRQVVVAFDDPSANEEFLEWLREHVHEPLTLAQLASQQHVSERSLVRKFRQTTGMSVFDWISQERVNQAKSLLETTDFPVGEIAAMVGFGTSETLRRNFDRHVGALAGAYRVMFRRRVARTDGSPMGKGVSASRNSRIGDRSRSVPTLAGTVSPR